MNGQEPILDWYSAKILMSFKLTKLNGNNIAANDNNGIVNGAHSFVKKLVLTLMAERFTIVMRQIIE